MKNQPDVPYYSRRVAAPRIPSSFNHPRSAGFSLEALQVDRRWRLFPVQPNSKLLPAKTRIAEASADPTQVEGWAAEFPDWNFALATGAASGVFVLEVDARSAGSLDPEQWDDWHRTLLMSAGEDKAYAFFDWPSGRTMYRKNLAPGLRLRGNGDYVLLPPSIGASGVPHVYWDLEASISAAPQWLADSAFAVLEKQSSSKILAFPNLPSQAMARLSELSCAQLVSRASSLPDPDDAR